MKPDGGFELDLLTSAITEEDRVPMGRRLAGSSAICSPPALEDSARARAARPDEPLEERHRDIARSVQAMYEEAFFHLHRRAAERYGLPILRSPAAAR